jgi:hypothetical protein
MNSFPSTTPLCDQAWMSPYPCARLTSVRAIREVVSVFVEVEVAVPHLRPAVR